MTTMQFTDWGEVHVQKVDDGEEYWVYIQVGGRDEEGEYELVLDGPAQGERCYL